MEFWSGNIWLNWLIWNWYWNRLWTLQSKECSQWSQQMNGQKLAGVSVSLWNTDVLWSYIITVHYDTMLDLFLQSPISTEPSHSNPWNLKLLSPTPTPSDIAISGDSGLWLDNFSLKSPDILTAQGFVRSMALFGLTPQNLFLRDGGARQRQASWWNCW